MSVFYGSNQQDEPPADKIRSAHRILEDKIHAMMVEFEEVTGMEIVGCLFTRLKECPTTGSEVPLRIITDRIIVTRGGEDG